MLPLVLHVFYGTWCWKPQSSPWDNPGWTIIVPLPEAGWAASLGTVCWVTSGFINGRDGQISPSSQVPALANVASCLEAFSGSDLKTTGKCATYFLVLGGGVCAAYRLCCVVIDRGRSLQLPAIPSKDAEDCCFVTLLSRKGLKILLLEFTIYCLMGEHVGIMLLLGRWHRI